MTRYAKTMSQALTEVQVRELKMNDPKLIKVFDKLKPKDTIKLKVSSGISKGKDFQPYTVRAKNTLRNGVEKITMILQGNPTGVKRFLYKKDGKVTFAIGDMAASIDDIKEEIEEGTWKYAETPKEIAALKKLMSRPLPFGKEGENATSAVYNLLGDDELSDMLYADGEKNPKGDARKTIIKWFKQRVKDNSYGLGDETKELGKKIGLKMDYVPEENCGCGKTPCETYGEDSLDEKYDLYHKSFSDAMQHAYDYAKKKLGITVDPKEIDDKVATGPKKPSVGKTNKYRLKGKGGNLQIQVYNKGGSKPFELNMYKEELGKEDEPKVKEIIKKLKGASQAHAGQAKDLEKAIDEGKMKQFHMMQKDGASAEEIAKALKLDLKTVKELMKEGNDMTEKLTDGNLSLKETVLKMWQEAVSPAQQAAIAISKKEKGEKPKDEKDEGNAFGKALKDAKDKGEKTFTVAGKEYDVKTEKLVGGQKKLDKDKDGDIDGKDFAMMRKKKTEEFSWPEYERYLETKKGSLRDTVLRMWGEEVKDDKKTLTKEKKDGKNKMTDTGKDMTPVDMAPKMPKIKNEKNKV